MSLLTSTSTTARPASLSQHLPCHGECVLRPGPHVFRKTNPEAGRRNSSEFDRLSPSFARVWLQAFVRGEHSSVIDLKRQKLVDNSQ